MAVLSLVGLSKAEVLRRLAPELRLSTIDTLYTFTVSDWRTNAASVIASITSQFARTPLLIRSSAHLEDGINSSLAGHFSSISLEARFSERDLSESIENIIKSYTKDARALRPDDQCFVQAQIRDVRCAGVVLTRSGPNAAPYYVINYDASSGRTDTVTRGAPAAALRIARWVRRTDLPPPWDRLVDSIREIEDLVGDENILDVEFAIADSGEIHIFQVRPISRLVDAACDSRIRNAVEQISSECGAFEPKRDALAGTWTVLSDMSDWNPAEMIGGRCNALDFGLYRFLITQCAWNRARVSLGYTDVTPFELMTRIANKPYIDTRVAFNSLTPAAIPVSVRSALIAYYISTLQQRPELHDKVEFELVLSCFDLTTDQKLLEMQQASALSAAEVINVRQHLVSFTERLVTKTESLIAADLGSLSKLRQQLADARLLQCSSKTAVELLERAQRLLVACRDLGAVPFARFARLAFVGIALLRSLANRDVLKDADVSEYFASLDTVAAQIRRASVMARDGAAVERFLATYGHLRPGTYDIRSPRLDKTGFLFENLAGRTLQDEASRRPHSVLPVPAIQRAFDDSRISLDAGQTLVFIRRMIELREKAKFEFSKAISEVLEAIATAGAIVGIEREDLGYAELQTVFATCSTDDVWRDNVLKDVKGQRDRKDVFTRLVLPSCLSSARDLIYIADPPTRPNFVTAKVASGAPLLISALDTPCVAALNDAIVMIESADPGYDWLFSRKIAGLVTKYGGVASHMAIRCAEFGIPAAIGCGERIYEELSAARHITLDCAREFIEAL